jgi:hypothetical protein
MGGVWLLSDEGWKATHADGGGSAVKDATFSCTSAAVQQALHWLQPCWAAL